MRKVFRIALREYIELVKTKAFIIGILLAPVLMGGSGAAMYLLRNQVDVTDKRVAVLDRSGVVADALLEGVKERNDKEVFNEEGEKIRPAWVFEIVEPASDLDAQRLHLSDRIRNNGLLAYVEIGPDVLYPGEDPESAKITYHAENIVYEDIRRWMTWPINNRLRELRTREADLDRALVDKVVHWVPVNTMGLVDVDEDTGEISKAGKANVALALILPMGLVMFMFMMIMWGATPLLQSTMEEKTLRIAEVLLGSVRPSELMAGKLLGNLAVSFTAMSVYMFVGFMGAGLAGAAGKIPVHLVPWFVVYMVLAVCMFGALNVAIGSACNDARELQQMTFPVMIPALIPMFVLVPVIKEPMSTFSTVLSLVPPFTPTLMLLRQAAPGGVPAWQPWVGLVGVILCTVFFVWGAGRVFRVGLLSKGQPPSLRLILKWAFRG